MRTEPSAYLGSRFPAAIISHAVWLYHCFSLSLREVELILAQRGIVVSYESVPRLESALRAGLCQLAQAAPAAVGRQVASG